MNKTINIKKICYLSVFCIFNRAYCNDINRLLEKCAFKVHPTTIKAVINVESSFNRYAIAVVSGANQPKQPKSFEEAVRVINYLEQKKANYSVGLAQINKVNFKKFGVTGIDLLDPCKNLQVSQEILADCYLKSSNIQKALSCYYSGTDTRGFVKDFNNSSYVDRIYRKANNNNNYVVPSIYSENSNNKVTIVKVQKSKSFNSILQRKLQGEIK